MKSINFLITKEFQSLFASMNTEIIKDWKTTGWKKLNSEELEIMQSKGLDVGIFDENLILSENGMFLYKGKKVVVYIRDQRNYSKYNTSEYKFHITDCSTLQTMKANNRYNSRYVVSDRKDGKFIVNLENKITGQKFVNQEKELKVCKNCLKKLEYDGYPFNTNAYSSFNIKEFFKKNNNKLKKLPIYNQNTAPISKYPENWKKISQSIKEINDWCCKECDINLKKNRKFLHVHHKDGNPANNNLSNLEALCIACHAKEFNHNHLKKNKDYNFFSKLKFQRLIV